MARRTSKWAFVAICLAGCSATGTKSDAPPPPPPPAEPDTSCYPRETYCVDSWTALYCAPEGRLATVTCGGPLGCTAGETGIVCDDSIAAEGDACAVVDHAACTGDKRAALSCDASHRFVALQACRGPAGCTVSAGHVRCDDSVALEGDGCAREDQASCSPDNELLLRCSNGTFTKRFACDGPAHCHASGDAVDCDRRISSRDDPCDRAGQYACSPSGSALLRCSSGRFVAANSCDGPGGCGIKALPSASRAPGESAAAEGIVCDDSVAVPEEPCAEDGEPACTVDGHGYLLCVGHVYGHGGACPRTGCRYDPGADRLRCDGEVVANTRPYSVGSILGTWVMHWASETSKVAIGLDPDRSVTVSLRAGARVLRAPATFKDGVLEFTDPRIDGYKHRFKVVSGVLRSTDRSDAYAPYVTRN